MKNFAVGLAALALSASGATAQDICPGMKAVIVSGAHQFSDIKGKVVIPGVETEAALLPGARYCQISHDRDYECSWEKSTPWSDTFDKLSEMTAACFPDAEVKKDDKDVSMIDVSYALKSGTFIFISTSKPNAYNSSSETSLSITP